ncbi:Lipoprotein-releasing system transmembrane protein LolE [Poriferisphaera corsica]|uniref:Lipoprotein-releasing system transmembrane protein LolE n=1 Tax=Poriferisphaera corsica TaxID=2528020 RepID=A0A517YQX2_9BACT|nr:FtsX-like permease family protein [Poriferisphaera corsica]QDU32615.1 Lipoprotein-releasing system transmembrane protein LolE [Poriferisphaera corsica]
MYKVLLVLKYLRRKLAPMFAALAVTMCTMMVIIVISVMGGFFDMLSKSAQKLSGDVTVTAFTLTGFPYYKDVIDEVNQLKEVEAATPVIQSYGLLNLKRGGENGRTGNTKTIEVMGIEPAGYSEVVNYEDTLLWTGPSLVADLEQAISSQRLQLDKWESDDLAEAKTAEEKEAIREEFKQKREYLAEVEKQRDGKRRGDELAEMGSKLEPTKQRLDRAGKDLPGMVMGVEVNPYHMRDAEGKYRYANASVYDNAVLALMPINEKGGIRGEPANAEFAVVNEFKSGLYDIDANRVYVPLKVLQEKLDMGEAEEYDPDTLEPTGKMVPARVTQVLVKSAPGYTAEQTAEAVKKAIRLVEDKHREMGQMMPVLYAQTWMEMHAQLLGAVQNEVGLVTFLFAIISVVAIVMVATTFYMIVLEKTRDIGVLRAIGASRLGIMNIYLGYGFAIGVVGAFLGLFFAYEIVTNLNEIQDWLYQWFGWRMWDPRTYFFDRIPDQVDPTKATWIVLGAIASSVVGALIPALLAARLNPIEALRYE